MLYVVTSPLTVTLLRGQLRHMAEAGFDVTVVSAPGRELDEVAAAEGVRAIALPMERELAPLADIASLWRLWRLLRRLRPHVTNVSTTKAGLLGGIAAQLAGVPVRIYVIRGVRFETARGLRRALMKFAESFACSCAHRAICVSETVRRNLEIAGVLPEAKAAVIGSGSSNGVDAERFAPTPERLARAREIRRQLGIPEDAPVAGYVGRFTRDKGLPELVAAQQLLRRTVTGARLLVIGGDEAGDPLPGETRALLQSDPAIVCAGFVADAAPYYHAMDVLALPTHREGFPNTVLEAYAAGKPVVAARATGVLDAVMDEGTGLLVPVGNAAALAEALDLLLKSPETRKDMGQAGRRWVLRDFRPVRIWRGLEAEYRRLLAARGLPAPVEKMQGASA